MEKKFNIDQMISEAMKRVARHIEMNANSLQSAYASKANARLVNDSLFGGPFGLNRSRVSQLADRAILGWL